MFRLAAIAGVTVQLPRMLCRIAAAAPGCPARAAYCADWAYRPKRIIAAAMPPSTPSGMRKYRPMSTAMTTTIAMIPMPVPMTIGSAFGFAFRTIPATMRICLIRPIEVGSAASRLSFFDAAPDALFTMLVRILCWPRRDETPRPLSQSGLAADPATRGWRPVGYAGASRLTARPGGSPLGLPAHR